MASEADDPTAVATLPDPLWEIVQARDGRLVERKADDLDTDVLRRSVQSPPRVTDANSAGTSAADYFVLAIASVADEVAPWGTDPVRRDYQLRQFFPTEAALLSALSQIAARNAAFSWTLNGPPRQVQRYQQMMNAANFGEGWPHFILSISMDLLTQDNGAFIEVIRRTDSPSAEVIGIASLDAGLCRRTGDPRAPVVYRNPDDGKNHLLQWWQVVPLVEMPSPIKSKKGIQFCAVSRVLRAAQILRDISIYRHEQVTGRHLHQIDIVSGISNTAMDAAIDKHKMQMDNQGLTRFVKPLVIPTLDPTQPVSHISIDLAKLPDNWDEDKAYKWYYQLLSSGLLVDYGELAPLPGGGLGTASQSDVMAAKTRAKGPGLFKKMLVGAMNNKILPRSVEMEYDEKDSDAEMQEAVVREKRATVRKTDIESGVVTVPVARQQAVDDGDLRPEYLAAMGEVDETEDVTVGDTEQAAGVVDAVEEQADDAAVQGVAPAGPQTLEALAQGKAAKAVAPEDRPALVQDAEAAWTVEFTDALARAQARAVRVIAKEPTRLDAIADRLDSILDRLNLPAAV